MLANKKTFVRLENLLDVTYEGETAEQRAQWLRNVQNSGVAEGYTYACDDEAGDYYYADFSTKEIDFVDVEVYDFMGSENTDERFYRRDAVTVRCLATGDYYILDDGSLGIF